jgi:hypothetical protein
MALGRAESDQDGRVAPLQVFGERSEGSEGLGLVCVSVWVRCAGALCRGGASSAGRTWTLYKDREKLDLWGGGKREPKRRRPRALVLARWTTKAIPWAPNT